MMMAVMRMRAMVGRRAVVHLQLVVFGKVHHEVPGHHIVGPQVIVDDDASHTFGTGRHTPRRVREVASVVSLVWAELTHDPGQALCPIAGAKRTTAGGHAHDVGLF